MTHLEKMLQPDSPYVFYDDQHGFCINTDDVLMLFEPERKKGEWFVNIYKYGKDRYECSECSKTTDVEYDFCPNCGADLRGEIDDK